MKANIGKGTDEFQFFGDFFKYVGNNYIPESDEQYWEQLNREGSDLVNKYSECEFKLFVKGMVLVFVNWIDKRKYLKKDGLRWHISLMTESEYERFEKTLREEQK